MWRRPACGGWKAGLRKLADLAIGAVCPPLCAACLGDMDACRAPVCRDCDARLAHDRATFCLRCGGLHEGRERHILQAACSLESHRNHRARCLYWMREPASTLIHQFKYRHVTRLAEGWGEALGEWLRPGASAFRADLVLPVPLHPARERSRGFNQAALLARAAGRAAGFPCVEDALRRARGTASQTGLDPAGRGANLAGAFLVWRPELIESRAVVLVDDVVTTGATLGGAVDALLDAGAASVASLAVARA